MTKNNALIALAYFKENENPLHIFCFYIQYCLAIAPNQQLRPDELVENIEQYFGLIIPKQVIRICQRMLLKEGIIATLADGAGYKLESSQINVQDFERTQRDLECKEDELIVDLINHIKKFNITWTADDAIKKLTNFLINGENAFYLFAEGVINPNNNAKGKVSDEWFIGKYIIHLLGEKNKYYDYLNNIIRGLMIYIGVHEIGDYKQQINQKFSGTNFFIDTKLLLRQLGYSWKYEVDSASELINLIRNEYDGNICLFEHTYREVEQALINASVDLKNNGSVNDIELRVFSELSKFDLFDFDLRIQSLREEITKKNKFTIKDPVDWADSQVHKFNLDWDGLYNYIQEKHPTWKKGAIYNDINSINYINFLRQGNYTSKFGGKKKLPVFITSNTALVRCIRSYIIERGGADIGAASWRVSALPIITDSMLTCRLWLPKAKSYSGAPALTLARNAYAAQQPVGGFFEKLKNTAIDLRNKHNIDILDIESIKRERLDEIIIARTSGVADEITPEIIAYSVKELVDIKTINLENKNKELENENNLKDSLINERERQIIASSALRYANQLTFCQKICIVLVKYWWLASTIIFFILGMFLSTTPINPYYKDGSIFLGAVSLFIIILEKLSMRPKFINALESKIIFAIIDKFSNKIKNSLNGLELNFEISIIQSAIRQTDMLAEYSESYIENHLQQKEIYENDVG